MQRDTLSVQYLLEDRHRLPLARQLPPEQRLGIVALLERAVDALLPCLRRQRRRLLALDRTQQLGLARGELLMERRGPGVRPVCRRGYGAHSDAQSPITADTAQEAVVGTSSGARSSITADTA
jgi:hypothetical protein